jgi:hypothetical protein
MRYRPPGDLHEVGGEDRLLRHQLVLLLRAEHDQRHLRLVGIEQVPQRVSDAGGDVHEQNARQSRHPRRPHGRADGDVLVQALDVGDVVPFDVGPVDDRNLVRSGDAENLPDAEFRQDVEDIVPAPPAGRRAPRCHLLLLSQEESIRGVKSLPGTTPHGPMTILAPDFRRTSPETPRLNTLDYQASSCVPG